MKWILNPLAILLSLTVAVLSTELSAAQKQGGDDNADLVSRVVERVGAGIDRSFNLYPEDQEERLSLIKDRNLGTWARGYYLVGGPEAFLPGPDLIYYTTKDRKIVPVGEPSKTYRYRQVVGVNIYRGETSSVLDHKPLGWPTLDQEGIVWNYKVVTRSSGTQELVNDRKFTYLATDSWKDLHLGSATGKELVYHVSGEQLQVTSYYESRTTRRPYGNIYPVDWKEIHAFCIVPVPGEESLVIELRATHRKWSEEKPSFHLPFITESEVSGVLGLIVAAAEKELGVKGPGETPGDFTPVETPSSVEAAPTVTPSIGTLGVFDANPLFLEGGSIDKMSPEALLHEVGTERLGAFADASSLLLLRVELSGAGSVSWAPTLALSNRTPTDPVTGEQRELREMELQRDGTLQGLHGARTHKIDGKDYAFCLYTPPARFDQKDPEVGADQPRRRVGGSEVREVSITTLFTPDGGDEVLQKQHQFLLARPPVLLVHGTFDDPHNCWQTSAREIPLQPDKGEVSMVEYLQERGHRIYLVDYQNSNGAITLDEFLLDDISDQSSFLDNARVLWTENGIKQALTDFRGLGFAATRVNVIGHSMGGLIARLWVSDFYNQGRYRRPDNFHKGDIHRLITIGTTHFGSDLSALHYMMSEALRNPSVPQLASQAAHNALRFLMVQKASLGASKAVVSQMPGSLPLKQIGPSRVPSHAIIGVATAPSLRDFDGVYLRGLTWTWRFFALNPAVLKSMLERHGMGDRTEEILYEGERSLSWLSGKQEVVVGLKDQVYLALRARGLLFGDQPNDMVVRTESQAGGLPLQYTTRFNHVLHSFEPRYREIQRSCAALLAGPQWKFYEPGFPAAGRKMLNVIPQPHTQGEKERQEAINNGGLAPSHAEAISTVAVAREEWILFRPVNPAATSLIQRGFATKDMFVKGKSSSWGPQKGYVCRQQAFSKLVGKTDKIKKFNALVEECLLDQRATAVPLRISSGGAAYEVRTIKGESEPRKAVVLLGQDANGAERWYDWHNDGEDFSYDKQLTEYRGQPLSLDNTEAMEVLADRFSSTPVTADYDLLAFGIRGLAATPAWDSEMGGITAVQKECIRQMNYAVRLRAHFLQGNVSHHGPEVQYPGSEGVDFPITLFSPEGNIYTAAEGPKGQKDREIKHWFHVIRKFGFTIDPNPVWEWGAYLPDQFSETGWDPFDKGARLLPVEIDNDSPYDSND